MAIADMMARNPRANNGPMMYEGGGPWMVLELCPALWHNTQSASVGRSRNGRQKQCICPRGLWWRQREKEQRAASDTERRHGASRDALNEVIAAAQTYTGRRSTDAALCNSIMGRKLADNLATNEEGATVGHRRMCFSCPARIECALDAIRGEGDSELTRWDGMYGGMTFAERKRARVALRELEAKNIAERATREAMSA